MTVPTRLTIGFVALGATLGAAQSSETESSRFVREAEALRLFITPPVGTPKSQVDAIFGTARVWPEGRWSVHVYELLPPTEMRTRIPEASLVVRYHDGLVERAWIKDGKAINNPIAGAVRRTAAPPILLRKLCTKFRPQLIKAVWNKPQHCDAPNS